jgi:hypothetical protein
MDDNATVNPGKQVERFIPGLLCAISASNMHVLLTNQVYLSGNTCAFLREVPIRVSTSKILLWNLFSSVLQANASIISRALIRPKPVPSISFPIHYSIEIVLHFKAIIIF